jgi:hypothetical protein
MPDSEFNTGARTLLAGERMPMGEADFRALIPLLPQETRIQDLEALSSWFEALYDALRTEVPGELMALWVYSRTGTPILVGARPLERDHFDPPRAGPQIPPNELENFDTRIRRVGYGSVLLRPVRMGGRDVGLLLVASFTPHLFGRRAESMVDLALGVIGPALRRVAEASGEDPGAASSAAEELSSPPTESLAELGLGRPMPVGRLLEATAGSDVPLVSLPALDRPHPAPAHLFESLSEAISGAGTPRDMLLALSFALQPVLPHDSYELLVPDGSAEFCYRLGLQGHGLLWSDPGLIWARETFDPALLFGERNLILLADADSPGGVPRPELVTVRGREEAPRSLIGVTLRMVERPVGYLLLGSHEANFYRQEDLALLDRVGALLAPRVDGLVYQWSSTVLQGQLVIAQEGAARLTSLAAALAAIPLLGPDGAYFTQVASRALPIAELEFALRLPDEERVVVVQPGQGQSLGQLPRREIEGTGLAAVIHGEAPYLLLSDQDSVAVLVVPLRVGGQIIGVMAVTPSGEEPLTEAHAGPAQQLADLAAPHLELARQSIPRSVDRTPKARPDLRLDR